MTNIPKRVSNSILQSLSTGVVPRIGLQLITVGRVNEVRALVQDLETVADGGAAFRFVVGKYGSGKTFLLQLIRNRAMELDLVVADVDLSPERRLVGSAGQGINTYRELVNNMATRTRPDKNALPLILDNWISSIQVSVRNESQLSTEDAEFNSAVEAKIMTVISNMEGMVHGFDFATVLTSYWRAYRNNHDQLKDAALKWLRGEYSTKTEARDALGVRVIIDDTNYYDYLKVMARFVSNAGYKGLIVFFDEGVSLLKITHTPSRFANYEKLLMMFNDTMQGKVENLGIIMSGTTEFVENTQRGLYSYEALRSRLAASRFVREGFVDTSSPVISLQTLSHDEIYVLLTLIAQVHSSHYSYECRLTSLDYQDFMQEILNRLGADKLLTPREIVRDFISVLNILHQNPQVSLPQLIHGTDFRPTHSTIDPDINDNNQAAELQL